MGRPGTWQLAVVAAVAVTAAGACNVREISDIIQNRFRQEASSSCSGQGEECVYDRECCRGLECRMTVTKGGVFNYCQNKAKPNNVFRPGTENVPLIESEDVPEEPASEDDGKWMLVNSEEGSQDENKPTEESPAKEEDEDSEDRDRETLDKIEQYQQKKRMQLQRENEMLERLFTEKDERELEQLRALKEDADMDELRRLKEMRLKRKLKLIQELKELRGMKAEENLDAINYLNNRTSTNHEEEATEQDEEQAATTVQGEAETADTNLEDQKNVNVQEELQETSNPHGNGTAEIREEPEENEEQEQTTAGKHKQGIHRRRHHQHRKRTTPEPTGESPPGVTESGTETNVEVEDVKENKDGNQTETVI